MVQITLTKDQLKRFVPLDALSDESLQKLLSRCRLQPLPAGQALFHHGDANIRHEAYFLLSGEIHLIGDQDRSRYVRGGSAEAAHALDPHQPRRFTAVAVDDCQVLKVDNELLDILLTWDQSAGYVVEEIAPDAPLRDDSDWMTRMLRSNIFYRVPPANIHAILTRMQSVRLRAGTTVIEQGAEGDYYYILKSGAAEVLRSAKGHTVRLAELGVGDGFGEEALMSDACRSASVRMLADGELMRLSKNDFQELLKAPLLEELTPAAAEALAAAREVVWLDVRLESEYRNGHRPGSINLPLNLLRLMSRRLPQGKPVIVCCDTGRRSSAAAYLLSERGFEVYVLKGGYQPDDAAA